MFMNVRRTNDVLFFEPRSLLPRLARVTATLAGHHTGHPQHWHLALGLYDDERRPTEWQDNPQDHLHCPWIEDGRTHAKQAAHKTGRPCCRPCRRPAIRPCVAHARAVHEPGGLTAAAGSERRAAPGSGPRTAMSACAAGATSVHRQRKSTWSGS